MFPLLQNTDGLFKGRLLSVYTGARLKTVGTENKVPALEELITVCVCVEMGLRTDNLSQFPLVRSVMKIIK